MPKNPKNPEYPPIRTPKLPTPSGGGGVVDVVPLEPLLLILSHLDAGIVAGLKQGDQILVRSEAVPIVVTTLMGDVIGQVRLDDFEAVRRRRVRRGTVVVAETIPLQCAVEVS
ncbi:MAG: hypothetical protein KF861_24530 [Planctomycetaceae bacterium]|nr:hypothetical protein [Planctomycetaceae bacterium]